jgi:hypothetical protein
MEIKFEEYTKYRLKTSVRTLWGTGSITLKGGTPLWYYDTDGIYFFFVVAAGKYKGDYVSVPVLNLADEMIEPVYATVM